MAQNKMKRDTSAPKFLRSRDAIRRPGHLTHLLKVSRKLFSFVWKFRGRNGNLDNESTFRSGRSDTGILERFRKNTDDVGLDGATVPLSGFPIRAIGG